MIWICLLWDDKTICREQILFHTPGRIITKDDDLSAFLKLTEGISIIIKTLVVMISRICQEVTSSNMKWNGIIKIIINDVLTFVNYMLIKCELFSDFILDMNKVFFWLIKTEKRLLRLFLKKAEQERKVIYKRSHLVI